MSETLPETAPEIVPAPAQLAPPAPTLIELFVAFAIVSLSGFGGVLAWSRRMLVELRRWLTPEEFNDLFGLCQVLPGPTVINLSVVFGRQVSGIPGAVAALAGLVCPGFVVIILFGFLYTRFGDVDALQRVFTGMAAAAAGLTISTSAKMAEPLFKRGLVLAPLVALAMLVAIGIMRWPIYWVLAIAVPTSITLAWWVRR
jgi:chromate transporter